MALRVSLERYLIRELNADVEIQTISAKSAAALDKDLMSVGGFSLDQLMELAGLSVSQAGMQLHHIRHQQNH